MRKHVAPAHPAASIPDPETGGFLPAEGRPVTWSAHWAGLAARQDITVADAPDEVDAEPAETLAESESDAAPAPVEAPAAD